MIREFRVSVASKKAKERELRETVHLTNVNVQSLGVPELMMEIFTSTVENLEAEEISNQDVVTINQLLDCFTKVLGRRAGDYQSHKDFREYIRNRLTIKLAQIQLAHRRATANQQ